MLGYIVDGAFEGAFRLGGKSLSQHKLSTFDQNASPVAAREEEKPASEAPPAPGAEQRQASWEEAGELPLIAAGFPEEFGDGCVRLDPQAVLRPTARSFALRVRGQSMTGAGIADGDIVIGEFTPEARPGTIVVALIDGESTLKRLVTHQGKPQLVSENPNYPDFLPLSELVIQGVVHTVVRRVT